MGELEVISQDLGRVFLNMVSNACYATDEKRRTGPETGLPYGQPGGYMPTLWLATHRGEDHAEVRIRDNGNGMPPRSDRKNIQPVLYNQADRQGHRSGAGDM